MLIGIDARAFLKNQLKGIGIYLDGLINALAQIDTSNQYLLYYDLRKEIVHRTLPGDNFKLRGVGINCGDTFFFWEQLALPWAIMSDKIDLFHATTNVSCLTKCPSIVTIHDTILQEMPLKRPVERFYYRVLQPIVARKTSAVITDSYFSRRCIIERFRIAKDRIKVIPLGLDKEFQKRIDKNKVYSVLSKYQIESSYILTVGGESPWKNVEKLIETYAFLVQKHKVSENLVIVGIRDKDILKRHLEMLATLDLLGRVRILGYIPKKDLIALFNGAEVFVYPSLHEGFGFPPLEAMACGIPVVASNAASIPEVVGDSAILCNSKDIVDMANAIKSLLYDEKLKNSMRIKGYNKSNEYNWKTTAEMTFNLYKSFIGK